MVLEAPLSVDIELYYRVNQKMMSRRMLDDPKSKYLIRKARERRHMARTSQVLDQKADEKNWAAIRMFFYIAFVGVLLLLMSGGHGLLHW